jgi:hypothetical protein
MNLRRLRQIAACVLWVEVLLRAFAPVLGIFLAYAVLALFGLGNGWLFAAALVLALASLGWEGAKFQAPTGANIDRRIEAASGLKHHPLAALQDVPATGGAMGAEIWRAHQARMAQILAQARAGWPMPFAAVLDPFSLRALLLLLLATGAVIAGPELGSRLNAGFTLPPWPFAGPQINAWVTPPAYAGQAPLLLTPGQKVTALTGSRITVILDGSLDAIRFGGAKLPGSRLGPNSRRADGLVNASGVLSIGPWWHRLARWRVTAVPPSTPVVVLNRLSLKGSALQLDWTASDAYGLAALAVAIRPPGYNRALPEGATLPANTGQGGATLDMRTSPYGGMTVAVTLEATNLANRHSSTPPQLVVLPPMPVHDPTAVALAAIRQHLALTPNQSLSIAWQIMHVAQAPPSAISYAADVQLAVLATALASLNTAPENAVQRLLLLIQQIEAGPDFAPSQALAQAVQKLLQALAHGPPDAATLNKLLAAMQQALAQRLAAAHFTPSGQQQPSINSTALNQLAAKIAADEKAGRTEQAQAELQQLAQALQALQNARPMTAAEAAQAQAAGQAAQNLAKLMQDQASLLNQTAQGNATPSQQAGLHAALNDMNATLSKAGIPSLPGLQGAAHAMQNAQNALTQNNNTSAQAAETSAIQNLQKAATALQNQTAQSLSLGMGGEMLQQNPNGTDPNGNSDDLSIPGLPLQSKNPADTIEQEIIHLDANPTLPQATHDYLHRLLTPDQ